MTTVGMRRHGGGAWNLQKAASIRQWINPEERVTVDFENEHDLNAEVIECDGQNGDVAARDRISTLANGILRFLSMISVGRIKSLHSGPDKPVQYGRLRITVHEARPQTV